MFDKKLYGTATVGSKGQVVIPAEAREELGLQPGDKLYVVGSKDKSFIGFIREEQMQQMVDHVTDRIQTFNDLKAQERD